MASPGRMHDTHSGAIRRLQTDQWADASIRKDEVTVSDVCLTSALPNKNAARRTGRFKKPL
jgi:hypothetical protein